MADDGYCEREQMPKIMCAHCKAQRGVVTAELPDFTALADLAEEGENREVGPLRSAYYDGVCPCGARIEAGDAIRYSVAEGRYVCADHDGR